MTSRRAPPPPKVPRHLRISEATTPAEVRALLGDDRGDVEIVFEAASVEALAELSLTRPQLLTRLLPPSFIIEKLHLDAKPGAIGLRVNGSL